MSLMLRSRLLFFVGDASLSFEELGPNCVVAYDTPVRRLVKTHRILRRFQTNQTTSHDDSSSTVCTSGRGLDPVATRVRSTLLSCLHSFQNLLVQVLLDFMESSFLENRSFFLCLTGERSKNLNEAMLLASALCPQKTPLKSDLRVVDTNAGSRSEAEND